MDEEIRHATVIGKKLDRLVDGEAVRLMSSQYFPVDETIAEAWASQKCCRPKNEGSEGGGGSGWVGAQRRLAFRESLLITA